MSLRTRTIAGKERHITGWQKDLPDARDMKMTTPLWTWMTLPAAKSMRHADYISRVEDQESIGSCTCNAGSSAEEMILRRAGKDVQLSRLWLYAEVRKWEKTPLNEDPGAQIRNVMKVLAKKGCPLESEYPYDLKKWAFDPPKNLETPALKHQILVYYRCPNLAQIKASIAQGFPVVGGFNCPRSMFGAETAQTGVLKYAPDEGFDGGHAVLFTGYDDNKKTLEFQNSWGTHWGDKGYGYLPYQYVTHGYADDFWSIRLVTQ